MVERRRQPEECGCQIVIEAFVQNDESLGESVGESSDDGTTTGYGYDGRWHNRIMYHPLIRIRL